MVPASRFNLIDGRPDSEQIEEWVETYFHNLLTMMNPFYSQVNIDEVLSSMKAIRFDQLAAKELAGESREVIELATTLINELAEREIEYMAAYLIKE